MRPAPALPLRRVVVLAIASGALACALLACSDSNLSDRRREEAVNTASQSVTKNRSVAMAPTASAATSLAYSSRADGGPAEAVRSPAEELSQTGSPAAATDIRPGTMLIRTATIALRVDSLERAIAHARALAEQLGGTVGAVEVNTGIESQRTASLELRVPSARFDEALTGVSPLGTVEHSASGAEDVGEEYVDMAARIANGHRIEERLIGLFATRTGKLSDVLLLERELARVRGEIEQAEGRRRYLGRRAATSSITLAMHEPLPIIAHDPADHPIHDALGTMWHNFTGLVAFSVASLGYVLPLGLVLLLAWRTRRAWRPRNEPATDPRA